MMMKNLCRAILFGLFLWGSGVSAAPANLDECADVGDGCVLTCEAWCWANGATPIVQFAGCGCPTVGSAGAHCVCHCFGDAFASDAITVEEGDPGCRYYNYSSGECDVCPE
jgi:hypothetical protein